MHIYNNDNFTYCINGLFIANVINQKYCVFDLEATGLDYDNEFIIQIGAIKFNYSQDSVNFKKRKFNMLVKPPISIPSKIERLTQITNLQIADKLLIKDVLLQFKEFVEDDILVAQCGYEFDFNILDNECKRNNLPLMKNKRLDTKVLYANLYPNNAETFSTDYFIKKYNIFTENFARHDALGDSMIISEILKNILSEYENKKIKDLYIDNALSIKKFIPQPLE